MHGETAFNFCPPREVAAGDATRRALRPLGFNGTDEEFCRHITVEAGVTAVPVSAFYDASERAPRHFARFCFCKHDETLDAAIERLSRHFKR